MQLFISLACLAIALDLLFFLKAYREKKQYHKLLTGIHMLCVIITGSYLISVITTNYFITSLFSSFYFCGISMVLFLVLLYAASLASRTRRKSLKAVMHTIALWVVLDTINMLVNPFYEFAISYEYFPAEVCHWQYHPMLHYQLHLILSYCMVLLVLGMLTYKCVISPRAFRNRYRVLIVGIAVVVIVNAAFLYLPGEHLFDYSLFLYTLVSGVLLWYNNDYAAKGMLNEASALALTAMSNPLVLFDFENTLVMHNQAAEQLVVKRAAEKSMGSEKFLLSRFHEERLSRFRKELDIQEFMENWGLENQITNLDENHSFRIVLKEDGKDRFYRCDFSVLQDRKGRIIGRIFMFTDSTLDYDLLTGFQSELVFRQHVENLQKNIAYPVGSVVVDINHLAEINRVYGKDVGDKAIRFLADKLREHGAKGSRYVRLNDANLLMLTPGTTIGQMRAMIDAVYKDLEQCTLLEDKPLEIQSAISMATADNPSLVVAIAMATKSMKAKKLMDASSAHSSLLDSLAQTLQESDSCTREHVRRTQIMGEKLGIRLGLSDVEVSNLKLLCLLHDIGKLGIPLDILNKPGKLTDDEWTIMRSHAEKGYRIAKASKELEDIADLILHHHECWNGKGYPDGLKQEAIPLLSRIIAVVDTYDAMTNDRPYRQAMSVSQACKELLRCAGSQFDPYIVTEFIEFLRESNLYEEMAESASDAADPITKPMGLDEGEQIGNRDLFAVTYTRYVLSSNGTILNVDDNFEVITGYSRDDLETYHLTQFDLIFADDLNEYRRMVTKMINANHEAFIEHRLRRKDGSSKFVYCHGRDFYDSVTREPRTQIIATDIAYSETVRRIVDREKESARRSLQRWEESIRRDPLTGLLNRIAFQNDAQLKMLDETISVAMLMLDVDYFKQFNDAEGHKKGDELLICVAAALKNSVGQLGFTSRMGGDEFGALLLFARDAAREEKMQKIEEIYMKMVAEVQLFSAATTLSMGASIVSEGIHNFNTLYKQADKALYQVKEAGRANFGILEE